MARITEAFLSLVLLILPLHAWSNPPSLQEQVDNLYGAMITLEDWVGEVDYTLAYYGLYHREYSAWTPCNATCGVGYKTRTLEYCTEHCTQTLFCNVHPCPPAPKPLLTRHATCAVRPNEELGGSGTVRGTVTFTQTEGGDLVIMVEVSGFRDDLTENSTASLFDHGFHVHLYGNIDGGCGNAGPHFNPRGVRHGGQMDSLRHVGDLGNIRQTVDGSVSDTIIDTRASLFGANSIIGRAIVIHENQDDLGRGNNEESGRTGNAGARLACCVIGIDRES